MDNFFLFVGAIFFTTFVVGTLLERVRIPWIFSALLVGFVLSIDNPFREIIQGQSFLLLAQLGMYFLLFIIGFEIDLKQLRQKEWFILRTTLSVILLEAFFGSLFINYFFGLGWMLSIIVALSFATVGEAILIPILDEFGLIKTRLGQTIIDVGILDDVIEILTLVLAVAFIGSSTQTHADIGVIMLSLVALFMLTAGLTQLKKKGEKFSYRNIETLFLFALFILFLFIGIGQNAEAAPFAAILAGLSLRTFIPEKRLRLIESEVKAMCYGFFAPIFFFWVGTSIDIEPLIKHPLLVLLFVAMSNSLKILGSYFSASKELGKKQSILLGIGLSVRFSTSIIIIKILYEKGMVDSSLYSIIMASTLICTFIVPLTFSSLLVKWNVANPKNDFLEQDMAAVASEEGL